MAEAGRLADLQEELRDAGLEFQALLVPWEGMSGGPPSEEEMDELLEFAADPEDPDRTFPIFAAELSALSEVLPYDGTEHPARCVIGPDRTLLWCEHGHSDEAAAREFLLDQLP